MNSADLKRRDERRAHVYTPDQIRERSVLDPDTGCWNWQMFITASGYGKYNTQYAHRASFVAHVGPIPDGLEIDHLCRNRSCVNPDHLEPVTSAENRRRAELARTAADRSRLVSAVAMRRAGATNAEIASAMGVSDVRRFLLRAVTAGVANSDDIRVFRRWCKHGHEFTPGNTYVRGNGRRICRTCALARWHDWKRRQ